MPEGDCPRVGGGGRGCDIVGVSVIIVVHGGVGWWLVAVVVVMVVVFLW